MPNKRFTFLKKQKTRRRKISLLGFTLLEVIVVVIIIGILASLAIVNYGPVKEQTIDREAKANLRLIQAAQKIYRMEDGTNYFASGVDCDPTRSPALTTDTERINECLKLSLPTGTSRNWNYETDVTGWAKAIRTIGNKFWVLLITQEEPDCGGEDCNK